MKARRLPYHLLVILAIVVLSALSLYLLETRVVSCVPQFCRAVSSAAGKPSAQGTQDISLGVANTLRLAPAKVYDTPRPGLQAHASTWRTPPTIEVGGEYFKTLDAQPARALIAHEYGHIESKRRGKSIDPVFLLAGNLFSLLVLLIGRYWISPNPRQVGGIAAVGMAAGTLFHVLCNGMFLASTVTMLMVGFVSCTTFKGSDRRRFCMVMALAAVFWCIGTQTRTHFFRKEEIFSDRIALQVAGKDATLTMLCLIEKEQKRETDALGPLRFLAGFQQWIDIHPDPEARAAAIGLAWSCP